MSEWIVDGRERACPQCGETKRSLAQHWRKSADCEFPALPDRVHEIVTGLLLGDASTGGRRATTIELSSTRLRHLEWVHTLLGPLSRGVVETEGGYRLRTLSHPGLNRYRRWYGTGTKRAPDRVELTQPAAVAWLACDAAVEFGGREERPALSLSAVEDGLRADKRELLAAAGHEPTVGERRLRFGADASRDLLAWAGDPPPGSVYKWGRERRVYDAAKRAVDEGGGVLNADADRIERHRALLAFVADALGLDRQRLTRDVFRDALAAPAPEAVAASLGGGSWTDALSVAGVKRDVPVDSEETASTSTSTYTPVPEERRRRIAPEEWDREAALDAIRDAADAMGEPLTLREYKQYRVEIDRPLPSAQYLRERYGLSWPDATRAAGVEMGSRPGAESPDYELFLDALQALRDELGEWPTTAQYAEHQPAWAPARGTAYGFEEFESWSAAIEDAREHQ